VTTKIVPKRKIGAGIDNPKTGDTDSRGRCEQSNDWVIPRSTTGGKGIIRRMLPTVMTARIPGKLFETVMGDKPNGMLLLLHNSGLP